MTDEVISIDEFRKLWPYHWVLRRELFLEPRLLKVIPIHRGPELIADYYLLLNYEVANRQGVRALALTPTGAFFSTASTKELMHWQMRNSPFNHAAMNVIKAQLAIPRNRGLSLCFGNWAEMALSSASSSHYADWVALHHVVELLPGDQSPRRKFVFDCALPVCLPVPPNFSQRLLDNQLMSQFQIRVLAYCGGTFNLQLQIQQAPSNLLNQNLTVCNGLPPVNAATLAQCARLYQAFAIRGVCNHPEISAYVSTFADPVAFFQARIGRARTFN